MHGCARRWGCGGPLRGNGGMNSSQEKYRRVVPAFLNQNHTELPQKKYFDENAARRFTCERGEDGTLSVSPYKAKPWIFLGSCAVRTKDCRISLQAGSEGKSKGAARDSIRRDRTRFHPNG